MDFICLKLSISLSILSSIYQNIFLFQQRLEGQNIESLKVNQVRSKLGLVSQEPVLFDRTLAQNIMYGDNDRQVTMDEVVDAAKKSNIHNFISSLPMVCMMVYL